MSGHEAPSAGPPRSLQPNLSFGDWIKSTPYLWITQLFAVIGFFASGIYYTVYVISNGKQSFSPDDLIKINAWIHIPLLLVSAGYLIYSLDDNKAGRTRTGFLWQLLFPRLPCTGRSAARDLKARSTVRSFKNFFVVFILGMLAYYSWTVFSGTKALSAYDKEVIPLGDLFEATLSDYLAYVLNTVGGIALLGSFMQLWRPDVLLWPALRRNSGSAWHRSGRFHQRAMIIAAVVCCVVPLFIPFCWLDAHGAIPKKPLQDLVVVLNWLSGAFNAAAMMLLISRLDSKLIGLQSSLVGVLYAYAAVQTLFAAFPPESMEVVKALTLYLVLIFKIYFFFIVHFALTQGRIFCYMLCAPQFRTRKKDMMKVEAKAAHVPNWSYPVRVSGILGLILIASISCIPGTPWAKAFSLSTPLIEGGISLVQLILTGGAAILLLKLKVPKNRLKNFVQDAKLRWEWIFRDTKVKLGRNKQGALAIALHKVKWLFLAFIVVLTAFYGFDLFVQFSGQQALIKEAGLVRMESDPLRHSDKGTEHDEEELVALVSMPGTVGDPSFAFPITAFEKHEHDTLELSAVLTSPGSVKETVLSSATITFPKDSSLKTVHASNTHDAHGSAAVQQAGSDDMQVNKYRVDVIRPEWRAPDTTSFELNVSAANNPPDTTIAYLHVAHDPVGIRTVYATGQKVAGNGRVSAEATPKDTLLLLELRVGQLRHKKRTSVCIGRVALRKSSLTDTLETISIRNFPAQAAQLNTIYKESRFTGTSIQVLGSIRKNGKPARDSTLAVLQLEYGNAHDRLHHERVGAAGVTMIEVMLNNLSGLLLFLCFLELASPRTAKRFNRPRANYGRVAIWLFLSIVVLEVIAFVSWVVDHDLVASILETQLLVWNTFSGLMVSVAYALFIARFDSTLMWMRSFEVRCLFGYAAIQPLFVVFGIAGGVYESIKIMTVVQALILKLWMVYVVWIALKSGALVTYLLAFPKLDRMANSVFRHGLLCRVNRHEHEHLQLEVYEYGELMLSGSYHEHSPHDYEVAISDLRNVSGAAFECPPPIHGNWRLSLKTAGGRTLLGRYDFSSNREAKKFERRFRRSIAYIKATYE